MTQLQKLDTMAKPRSEEAIKKAEKRKKQCEYNDLLFQDICARLPYHVKCKIWLKDGTTEEGVLDLEHNYADVLRDTFYYNEIKDIKPYLRQMSSMTEEEKEEYHELCDSYCGIYFDSVRSVDWLNKKMFDCRGLIPKDLAISTEVFNPYII